MRAMPVVVASGCIGGNLNTLPLTLIANPRFKKPEDLRGASLGTSSLTEGTALYTMEILSRHGLHYPGDYEFAIVGVHTARWEASRPARWTRRSLVPLNFVALDAGYSNLGNAYDYLPEIAFISILVDETWATANREVLINVLAAIKEATDMVYDPANDEISMSLVNEVVRTDLKYVRQSLDLLRDKNMMPRDLSVPAGALATSIRLMRSAGALAATYAKEPQGAIDDSYREAALAIVG